MTVEQRHDPSLRSFASDNYAGVHPEVLAAIATANGGHQVAYGDDVYTARLQEVFRGHFGDQAEVFPVFNGTGANVVSLQSMTKRWESVICAASAHINVDEGGAPEKVAGLKLLPSATPLGKLTPEHHRPARLGLRRRAPRAAQVVSITQTTELGTCYSLDELAALCAHAHSLRAQGTPRRRPAVQRSSHSRAAAARVHHRRRRRRAVVRRHQERPDVRRGRRRPQPGRRRRGRPYLRKTSMQLSSKMRFVSAQLEALLGGDLWLRNARTPTPWRSGWSRPCADIPGVEVQRPVQANAVFAVLPREATERLQAKHRFYVWNEHTGEVRWMTSFDTTEADIDAFAADIKAALA